MDFDLEAPGLHYKFPQFVNTIDIKKGLVDYIYEFVYNKVIPQSLNDFTLEMVYPSKSQGEIQLIPAGNSLSPDYWRKLAKIDWHSLFYEENSEGIPFFLELKERIEEEFNPDFLLIDSRTGITEMSGLCTSLFPNKVVFLIINNKENIEGARQILQSIQKTERLPGQDMIEVIFALTRIPFPKDRGDEEIEKQIVRNIQNFLNEPVEDLESQLDIRDICVLHSDRELELSESLRMNQKEIAKETPLSRDYLRLFSKVIPEKVILSRLDSILGEITTPEKIRKDLTRVQQELEGIAASYLHPKTLGKLIDFYIFHNAEREKILNAFHELWTTFGINNPEMLSKYVSIFMEGDLFLRGGLKFKLDIVEKYLGLTPDKVTIEMKLASAYWEYGKPKMALRHYCLILNEAEEKGEILGKIFDICINENLYDAVEFTEKYSDIINSDVSLRVKKIEILFKAGKIEEVQKMLDKITENFLLEKNPTIYFSLMEELGKLEKANEKLYKMLNNALISIDPAELFNVGKIYYELGREKEFGDKIEKHPEAEYILYQLDMEYKYYSNNSPEP